MALILEHVRRSPSQCGIIAQGVAVTLAGWVLVAPDDQQRGGTATPRGEQTQKCAGFCLSFQPKLLGQTQCGWGIFPTSKVTAGRKEMLWRQSKKRMEWSGRVAVNWIYCWKRDRRRKGAQNSHLQNMGRQTQGIILETLGVSAAVVGCFCTCYSQNVQIFKYFQNFTFTSRIGRASSVPEVKEGFSFHFWLFATQNFSY